MPATLTSHFFGLNANCDIVESRGENEKGVQECAEKEIPTEKRSVL